MPEETYNGWKNHATWAVNLHLSNDEPLYRETLQRTENAMDVAEAGQIEHPYWSEEQCLRYGVADMLKTWITDELIGDYLAGIESGSSRMADEPHLLVMDLALGYLADVSWEDIADSWIEQVVDIATTA